MTHLVADKEHVGGIDHGFDRGRVSGVSWLLVKRQLIFVPGDRLAERHASIDRNRVVPQAGEVVPIRLLQDVGKAVGRPDLRPFDLSQQVAAGHVVIVVMRGDDDLDRADAEVPFHGVDRVQPRAP